MHGLTAGSPGGGRGRGGGGRRGLRARSAHCRELVRGCGVRRTLLPRPALYHEARHRRATRARGGRGARRGPILGSGGRNGESFAKVRQRRSRRTLVAVCDVLQLMDDNKDQGLYRGSVKNRFYKPSFNLAKPSYNHSI